MSITNLGKRKHLILRFEAGSYVDGEWVEPLAKELLIYANIQPSTLSYRTQMLPTGEREKEAIAIYSNDWLYSARKGENPIKSDVILYRGAQWQIVVSKPYGNFGRHCESLAIKLDESIVYRVDGDMGVII